ncbi:MAG: type II toxin-antitoxin system HicB family antitoxin [Firmicutes bacterium]|nr:type II toxin-antitoxin system HicB family antitoxin [Bacillota bacterium]
MRLNFTVAVVKDDNWYVASCLENSVASQGKTIEDALDNLREALELYFEDNDDTPTIKQTFITTMEIAV